MGEPKTATMEIADLDSLWDAEHDAPTVPRLILPELYKGALAEDTDPGLEAQGEPVRS